MTLQPKQHNWSIEKLKAEIDMLRKILNTQEQILKEIKQAECKHDYQYSCSGHNSSIYTCTKCEKLQDR